MESTQRNILIGSSIIGVIIGFSLNKSPEKSNSTAVLLIVFSLVFLYGAYVIARQNPRRYYALVGIMGLLASMMLGTALGEFRN